MNVNDPQKILCSFFKYLIVFNACIFLSQSGIYWQVRGKKKKEEKYWQGRGKIKKERNISRLEEKRKKKGETKYWH